MVRPLKKSDASKVAEIHKESLKGDFLPLLGHGFLTAFYNGIINEPKVGGFGIIKDSQLIGFIIGTTDMPSFFKLAIKKSFLKLALFSLISLLQKPSLTYKFIETFRYPNKEKGPSAELVVIAILENERGKGYGQSLVQKLEGYFKQNRIKEYKVTVLSNKPAIKFYKKLNFAILSKFILYNKLWYVYSKKI